MHSVKLQKNKNSTLFLRFKEDMNKVLHGKMLSEEALSLKRHEISQCGETEHASLPRWKNV